MLHVAILEEILQKGWKCESTQANNFDYLMPTYSKRMEG
jgi:hypothetical protein